MKLHPTLIAALAACAIAAPVAAKDDGSTRYDQWEERLRNRVTALHVYPEGAEIGAMGDVTIGFRIGPDGAPQDIVIRRSSGHALFDSAAVRLVSRLGRLGPVPSANGAIERVVLKLSYGKPQSFAERRRLAKMDAEERAANERRNRLMVSTATRLADKR